MLHDSKIKINLSLFFFVLFCFFLSTLPRTMPDRVTKPIFSIGWISPWINTCSFYKYLFLEDILILLNNKNCSIFQSEFIVSYSCRIHMACLSFGCTFLRNLWVRNNLEKVQFSTSSINCTVVSLRTFPSLFPGRIHKRTSLSDCNRQHSFENCHL